MESWLTPNVAVLLMLLGVVPALLNVYLLYDERYKPGVVWFLVSMAIGALWALLFAMMTLIPSERVTLALANVFWVVIPAAAVSMFLLAYEFVFKGSASRQVVAALFAPIGLLFLLTWINPGNLVFTEEYYVDESGFLHFSLFGGVLRVLVTQVYGYMLVFLAAGMFVGEAMRTRGIHRRQAIYLLLVFSALVASTGVKLAGFVPIYYDPTSTAYAVCGLLFAYSINKHGLLKFISVAREQTFEEVTDVIVVIDPEGVVVDINQSGRQLFGAQMIGESVSELLSDCMIQGEQRSTQWIELEFDGETRYFSIRESPITYGRGLEGKIIVMSDISELKERENELNLLKEILSRVFRHNIRNDLTVINGYADLIRDQGDDRVVELAEGIHRKSDHLLNQAEKTRRIEEVIAREDRVTGSLKQFVDQAVSSYHSADDDVVIGTAVEDDPVEVHPHFHLAIRELIENAITHHTDPERSEIEIYTETSENGIALIIQDNGPGIPQHELDVLHAQEETTLKHGSGVGLWLVRWIVDHSNGELSVETTDHGTRIEIRLSSPDGPVNPERLRVSG